jgi:hypothetical protein
MPKATVVAVMTGLLLLLSAGGATSAFASAPSVPPYGEVVRFGGFDSVAEGAVYGASSTSGLQEAIGDEVRFVYPVGMAVDSEEPDAPDGYAIYVLDNLNPQAINGTEEPNGETPISTSLSLEYRIQKIDENGRLLGSTRFTLASKVGEPNLRAVSLAVDGKDGRVYVLIADHPTTDPGSEVNAAYKIDAWTTALGSVSGLPDDPSAHAGEIAGPDTPHPLQGAAFVGDIQGESIAVDGSGANADLALAGNKFTSEASESDPPNEPVIELIKTEVADAGEIAGEWKDAAGTEDPAAKAAEQASTTLYSLSANPDGSLTVSLGERESRIKDDKEPNMATVSADLGTTSAVLPWADATSGSELNLDRSATAAFVQEIEDFSDRARTGGTPYAGTLAPSVVQLAGDGASYPPGLYAGLVADSGYEARQNPVEGSVPSWRSALGERLHGILVSRPASLGIRVFDANEGNGEESSLAMIGDVVPGGPCNLEGGVATGALSIFDGGEEGGSYAALAPGREGVLFALVQPDLMNPSPSIGNVISPTSPLVAGGNQGDQVVEFAPGASAAGANASKWRECPQPLGDFSVSSEGKTVSPGAGGELDVLAGSTLQFDAGEGEVNLQGASPWAYDWDLEDGVNEAGEGPVFERPWTVGNTFTASPGSGNAWQWSSPLIEAKFKEPGTYTEKLSLINDFGTLAVQQKLRVIAPGAITNAKVVPAGRLTEGVPAVLDASATLPQGDKVKNYHWEFGDGESLDTGETGEVEHTYAHSGPYTVKVEVADVLGQKVAAEELVNVAAVEREPEPGPGSGPGNTSTTPPATTAVTTTTTPLITGSTPPPARPKPLTSAQKLAGALKVCKKIKAKKQRATCEKQAKKKYAPKPKPKKHTTKKK